MQAGQDGESQMAIPNGLPGLTRFESVSRVVTTTPTLDR